MDAIEIEARSVATRDKSDVEHDPIAHIRSLASASVPTSHAPFQLGRAGYMYRMGSAAAARGLVIARRLERR